LARTHNRGLAKTGCVAVAADIFGQGVCPANVPEAQQQSDTARTAR